MLQDLLDGYSGIHIAVQHCTNQVDTVLAHDIWYAEIPIQYLVHIVKRILFVDDRIEQDSQSPNILLLAAI